MIRRRSVAPWLGVAIALVAVLATMSWTEPPRFDGAGYATLGRALATGQGYRDIAEPGSPPHAHFPPAYPSLLAIVWRLAGTADRGRFTILAHAASLACLAIAVGATGRWFRAVEPRRVAPLLTLALAANWTWVRTGGVIRSEPLALALGALTLLAARRAAAERSPAALGAVIVLLGVGVLDRQVTACWVAAVALDLALRRRWAMACSVGLGVAVLVAPWAAWQVRAGSGTQSGLFRGAGLARLVGEQTLFYARRIPDAIAGPFIEVATVFGRSSLLGGVATAGASAATAVVVLGWVRLVRIPRRRLGGLIPLATLPLLLVWPFTEAGRFLIPLVPFLLLGAVEGGAAALGLLKIRRARTWASRLVLAASLPYSAYAIVAQRGAAERATQRDFDAACAWLARQPGGEAPVMARHPADVAWLSGRLAVGIPQGGADQIGAAVRRYGVAFLVIDEDRYARGEANPLRAFVAESGRARRVWGEGGPTAIYEIPGTRAKRPPGRR